MTRRITALAFAVLLPLCFILFGCSKSTLKYDPQPMPKASPSGARLSVKEYESALDVSLTEKYTRNLTQAAMLMGTNGSDNASQIKKYAAEGNALLDTMEQGLKEVLALNPPQIFEQLHAKLISSLALEWEWVQLHRALFSSKSNADVNMMNKEFELWRSKCDDAANRQETYFEVFMELKKQMKTLS